MKDLLSAFKDYSKNLFRNKRITATHVFVLIVSDEHRKIKPYTLPAKLLPCRTLRDQFVRDEVCNGEAFAYCWYVTSQFSSHILLIDLVLSKG